MSLSDDPIASISKFAESASRIPVRNLWHMLLYAWGEARFLNHWKSEVESAPNLDALLASILNRLIRQRFRIGLGRDYRVDESLISGIRGRIKFTESLKRLTFLQGKAYCSFQTFNPNVAKNQIVRSTLAQLVQTGDFGRDDSSAVALRHELRRTVRDLDVVDMIDPSYELIRRQLLKRHDADYRLMLVICELLNQSRMPTESVGELRLPQLDRAGMVLWRVFERFVAQFYSIRLRSWTVKIQPSYRWNKSKERLDFMPVLKPDLAFRHQASGRIVILDTKFTPHLLTQGQWGNETVNRDHLFQMYAYLRSQEHRSEAFRKAKGVLLYPSFQRISSIEAVVDGHEIHWATVDLSKAWNEVELDLLEVMRRLVSEITLSDGVKS